MDSDLARVNGKSGRQSWRYADAFQRSIISEAIYHFTIVAFSEPFDIWRLESGSQAVQTGRWAFWRYNGTLCVVGHCNEDRMRSMIKVSCCSLTIQHKESVDPRSQSWSNLLRVDYELSNRVGWGQKGREVRRGVRIRPFVHPWAAPGIWSWGATWGKGQGTWGNGNWRVGQMSTRVGIAGAGKG